MMAEHNWGKWEPLCISLQIYVRSHWSKSQHHLLIFQPSILCRLRVVRCEMWDVTVSVVSVVTVALHWRHWTLWAVRTLPCFLYWENRGSQPAPHHTTTQESGVTPSYLNWPLSSVQALVLSVHWEGVRWPPDWRRHNGPAPLSPSLRARTMGAGRSAGQSGRASSLVDNAGTIDQ